jgi:hypothetical protein
MGIRAGLAACAASAALLACGEPETVTSQEPAEPPPSEESPAPAESPPIVPKPPAVPPAPAPAPSPPPEAAPPAAPPPESAISLDELGTRIKQTPAIGTFSKLALKNDLDDLVDGLRGYHARKEGNLDDLHQRYEALVLKLMTLLEEDEPDLALALGRSRERIWNRLVDPVEFAKLST